MPDESTRLSQITSSGPTVTAGVLLVRSWHAPAADWRMLGFAPVTLSIATRLSVGSVSCSCLRESRLSLLPGISRPTSWVPGGRGIDLDGWREDESSTSILHMPTRGSAADRLVRGARVHGFKFGRVDAGRGFQSTIIRLAKVYQQANPSM